VDVVSSVSQRAHQVENSVWLDRSARVGLVCYGIVHLVLAWLALQLAFGDRSGAASQQGAFQELASQPFGAPLLIIVAIGMLALAGWQGIAALWGHRREDNPKRLGKRAASAAKTAVYLVLAFSAFKTAIGESSGSSTDHYTAELMKAPAGRLLVGALGLALIGIGIGLAVYGLTKKFEEELESGATSGPGGTAIVRLGQAGYCAKGVAFGVVGGLFVWAAWTFDADKAGGLDVALRTVLDQPFGPWLLGLVALGLGAFGLFCFARARYADTSA
jgi:hypothetical protein